MNDNERGLMASSQIPVAKADEVDAAYCLNFLYQIRDVAFATLDSRGLPAVRIIDVMYADKERLYFMIPRGKAVYEELIKTEFAAIVGQTTDFRTCRISGRIVHPTDEAQQHELVDKLFDLNPGMSMLYPGDARYVSEVFYMQDGKGEYFDLGRKPILRVPFAIGSGNDTPFSDVYRITEACTGCGTCAKACPQSCIEKLDNGQYSIIQSECLRCGICMEVCPFDAIEKNCG